MKKTEVFPSKFSRFTVYPTQKLKFVKKIDFKYLFLHVKFLNSRICQSRSLPDKKIRLCEKKRV